jgi:nicotinamidase-related amidase
MDAERTIELSPQGSALIIVDMQAEGCERHGAGVKPIIRNIRALLDRFRQANGKIIHVQSVRAKDHPEFTFFGKAYSLIEDSPAVEFVEELKPTSDEVVVKKYSHDCFYQTSMKEQLNKFDLRSCRDHIVVTGIGSNNCVCGHRISHKKLPRLRAGGLYPRQPGRGSGVRSQPVPLARL